MRAISPEQIQGRYQYTGARRKDDADRINTSLASPQTVEGFFLVDGSGEAIQELIFPIKFIERPSFKYGGEYHLDSNPVAGQMATLNCNVYRWTTDPPGSVLSTATLKLYFVGCQLTVVTTGPTTQRMWVHWSMSGKALQNPAVTSGTTTDTPI